MIVFVVPLRSQQSSNSWDRVLKLFERCIKAICNQTSPDFRVIVICHKNPHIEFNHSHITYIEVDLPPPAPALKTAALKKWEDPDFAFKYLDKLQKVLT
ncbi:glycosyltransferase family A protein [Coleofasciculus sp. H7-2]|uniref:glycosyltransferase family A protein n=1 Tax=Coleofasciculus sp. H7-2 TaxID=3351545 RepID=UPI003670C4FB